MSPIRKIFPVSALPADAWCEMLSDMSKLQLTIETVRRVLVASPLRDIDAALVVLVCQTLLRTGSVPLPGGHGPRYGGLLDWCARYRDWPGVAQRAYVTIGLLAGLLDAEAHHVERWHAKEWLAGVEAWFDQFDHALPLPTPLPQRWRAMLAALLALVLAQWGSSSRLGSLALDRSRQAHERLQKLMASRQGAARQPLHAVSGSDIGVRGDEGQWRLACAALAQSEQDIPAELAHALYFMHVLHSLLVVRQPALERDNEPARGAFYGRLRTLLDAATGACDLCQAARRTVAALPRLAVFEQHVPSGLQGLADRLPPCFRAYERGAAPHWEFVAEHIDDPVIRRDLQRTHRLAEVVADILIDPLRAAIGQKHGVFSALAYTYLAGLMGTTRHQGLGYPVGPHGEPREALVRLFKRLAEGDLQQQAGALLGELPPLPVLRQACAVCLAALEPGDG